jgi:hypothetical protein
VVDLLIIMIAVSVLGLLHRKVRSKEVVTEIPVPPGVAHRLTEFDLRQEINDLRRYVRTLLKVFGSDLARQPPVHFPPMHDEDRLAYLKVVIRLAARRYGVPLERLHVRFKRKRTGGEAGRISIQGKDSYVEITDQYKETDQALTVIAAHEMAHYALVRHNTSFDDQEDNEKLTDSLSIMAGFGPLMLDVYHSEFSGVQGEFLRTSAFSLGYLHPLAVAYLTLVQLTIAGEDPKDHVDVSSPWYRHATVIFNNQRTAASNTPRAECYLCGEPLPAPAPGTRGLSACVVCKVIQRALPQVA